MAAVTLVDISSTVGGNEQQAQLFNIINLQDPSNDNDGSPSREYMLVNSNNTKASSKYDICEIQTVLPHSGKYGELIVLTYDMSIFFIWHILCSQFNPHTNYSFTLCRVTCYIKPCIACDDKSRSIILCIGPFSTYHDKESECS